jgi:hypothetical protein
VEISRERVPLRNAYRHVGQQAVLRVNSGEEYTLQGALQLGGKQSCCFVLQQFFTVESYLCTHMQIC